MNTKEIIQKTDECVLGTYTRLPLAIKKGEGVFVYSPEGKKYLDFFAGLAVDNLGHGHSRILKALNEQAQKLIHVSNLMYTEEQANLAEKLVSLSGLSKVFLCNSGTESLEAALKLARYSSIKAKGSNAYEIIACEDSFHGRSLGALSATMQEKYQTGFGPLVPGFVKAPYNDCPALETLVTKNTAAILLEPIQGEGGVRIPHPDYLTQVRKLCDDKKIYFILDEVQTGIGRTGSLFAYEKNYEKNAMKPDILCLAKGLGSGFPIGATLVNKNIADSITPGTHASTFGGNALASRIALETLNIISQKSFLLDVEKKGLYFLEGLKKIQKKKPLLKEIRGMGLMVAIELNEARGKEIVQKCLEKGLIINTIQNKILRFVPPLIVETTHIDEALDILNQVL
ncbi:MAG: hypothetical protein A3G32_08245 [Deltaproteobacteria bacterium RIFCSPLOWO2_12_FULL_40_28]|nr:MAG: hypothetical protein A3C45_00945 [Deltaproteobacteria bacterium RIFCSPHIGHO2_02_FULL_40_28]OGQ20899.1 MAG: hypothetical protein A3E27_03610 [Deltaproteobacteria bacterium RIFCSPHIGHO2_12_FULL_40_32]OGQ39300.1 MAG: hypothetical protein A3I69_04970 [Deltaproteobacteria bacterium RIFCSPLOWO2_02_FULL_40_36]OGQ54581.1 MAG: hypothetical protein A3G32_08245 [Deltaproteobacteria bacterium RIFCSPLOWO2_12_FULL_40_28]